MALEMAEADASYYMPYQYGNEANPLAHYNGTAPEILEELDEVAAFVAGLGTGGTLMGNARRLKEHDPDTLIVAAEPLQGELVQGLRSLDDGFIPPIIDLDLLDRKIFVSNRDSVVWTKKLLAEEGLFVGRVERGDRGDRRAGGREARRGQRRLRGLRRRLEVPELRRLHAGRWKSSRPTARSSARRSGSRLRVRKRRRSCGPATPPAPPVGCLARRPDRPRGPRRPRSRRGPPPRCPCAACARRHRRRR